MQTERKSDAGRWRRFRHLPAPHLPANRHPAPTNTLPRRGTNTTSIPVPLALTHLIAIKLHATPTHAQIREHRVNALLSARRAPHDNQLLRRPQRLVPHGLTHPISDTAEKPQSVPATETKSIRLRIERPPPQSLLKAHIALRERRVEEFCQERQIPRSASNRNHTPPSPFLNDSRAAQSLRQARQTDHVHRPQRTVPALNVNRNDLHVFPR